LAVSLRRVSDEPLARLPDHVQLDLSEIALLLSALDEAAEYIHPANRAARNVRRGIRLLTAKVWPELGELLDDDGGTVEGDG
jgi:hypothetical protein